MSAKRRGGTGGIVYSTNPNFAYTPDIEPEPDTLPPAQQRLRLRLERAGRGGKTVTIVDGFVGSTADLKALGQWVRKHLSTGGSAGDGQLVVQGDVRQRLAALLRTAGYVDVK